MDNKQNKTTTIRVRLTPLDKAMLSAEAKDNGSDLSKWVRTKLGIPVTGRVNSETGEVHLVTQADMERKYVGHDTGME